MPPSAGVRATLLACAAVCGLLRPGEPARAQGVTASADPAAVHAGTYKAEPSHTQILWAVNHQGFTTYYGSFSEVSGQLTIDPKDPAAATLKVTLPVSSVLTTSGKLTDALKGPGWLDQARFPEASFTSDAVKMTGPRSAAIGGKLTLHGVTMPLVLQARFEGTGVDATSHKETVGFSATGMLKRSDFGVTAMLPRISDEVQLTISGAFVQ